MLKKLLVLLALSPCFCSARAQTIRLLNSGQSVSLRGLSVVNDHIIWVSGSAGSVGRSSDGGKTWHWMQVPHYEKTDFRDIEAFSEQEAVVMGITAPAVIFRTTDGGKSWTKSFEDSSKSVFLDDMDFSGDRAVVVGDPEGDRIFIARSEDRGKTWKRITSPEVESTVLGEAFFAASGSNICWSGNRVAIVSGGKNSCLYISSFRYPLQMNQGAESTGANSIAVNPTDSNQAFVVGGDFKNDSSNSGNSLLIQFSPFRQIHPQIPPHGYRSCVEYIDNTHLICCGTTGVDFSSDAGSHWKLISANGFHVCSKAKSGNAVFMAGPNGSIAVLIP
jgi:hypothetical protein